jgi:transcriptional regulator with XRE-family HTH domain
MKNARSLARPEMKNIFGGDIRKYRDELCYPQAYVANQLGITQSAYYKLEAGVVKISLERLIQIAEILGKPIEAFLEKEKYNAQLKCDPKILISRNELALLKNTLMQYEQKIEALENELNQMKAKTDV